MKTFRNEKTIFLKEVFEIVKPVLEKLENFQYHWINFKKWTFKELFLDLNDCKCSDKCFCNATKSKLSRMRFLKF